MNVPESAKNVVLIDFDGTIIPWGDLMGITHVSRKTAQAIARLKDAGFHVVIFSSRFSPRWIAEAGTTLEDQAEYVTDILTAANIPFDELTAEKLPARAYFDDNAFRVSREWPLDQAIEAFLLSVEKP